jgi:predicted flap endonuclease-1-like 5' DNA nuclease
VTANAAVGAPRAAALLTLLALASLAMRSSPAPAACATPQLGTTREGVPSAPGGADSAERRHAEPGGAARLLFGLRLDPHRDEARALEALPGIGPARARAIVREARLRPFCRAEDLERVAGIGPVIRSRLAAFLETPPGACPE